MWYGCSCLWPYISLVALVGTNSSRKNRFFIAFILCGIALCTVLGVWQVQRLAWKNDLEAQIEVNLRGEAEPFQETFNSESTPFKRVTVNGAFVDTPSVYLVGKYYGKEMGLHALQPYKLDNGDHVLINTGWVKDEKAPILSGAQEVEAIIMPSKEKPIFLLPSNNTDTNIWLWETIPQLQDYYDSNYNITISDVLLQRTPVESIGEDIVAPIPASDEISLYNSHLSYAITWFSLAAILLGLLLLYVRNKSAE